MPLSLTLLLLFGASIGAMLLLLVVVRRHPEAKRLRDTNDVAGFYVTLFSALYGVFLGFMILTVWTRFDEAETLVGREATAVTNLYVLVGQLHDPIRSQVRTGLEQYSHLVVNTEWDAMARGETKSQEAFDKVVDIWLVMGHIKPADMGEQVIMGEAFNQMTELYQARRLRLLANEKRLPFVLWSVLIIGGVITAGSTAFFGVDKFVFHAFKMSLLTALICLLLYATWEIDQPFRNAVRVSPEPFVNSTLTMAEIRARELRLPPLDTNRIE